MSISDETIKILNHLGEKIGISIDWTSQNILPYVQELCGKYIKWEIATSITWIIIATIVFVLGIIVCEKILKVMDNWEGIFMYRVIEFFVVVIFFLVAGNQVLDIVKCSTFPELAVYEYVSSQINLN